MKLASLLVHLTILLAANAQHDHGGDGGDGSDGGNSVNFQAHQPGTGNIIQNLYMHTLGHFISDFPKYLGQLASGDIFGFIMTLIKFVLYHNPVNLLQDFGGGLLNTFKGGQ